MSVNRHLMSFLCLLLLAFLPQYRCLSFTKFLDATRGDFSRVRHLHSKPLWLDLGLLPLATTSVSAGQSNRPPNLNRYSDHQPKTSLPSSGEPVVKSATLADIAYPKSGSNRDAAIISTKATVSKRAPLIPTDGNRYQAMTNDDNFNVFNGDTSFEDFFDNPLSAASPNNADSSSSRPAGKPATEVDDNLAEMFKSDLFNLDMF